MSDDLMDTLDAAAFCAEHVEWQAAIRSAIDEIVRLRAVLDAIDALPSPLHDDDSQSLVEAVEDCWGNSDDIAHAGWKIGYAAALVDVWRILLPGGQQ